MNMTLNEAMTLLSKIAVVTKDAIKRDAADRIDAERQYPNAIALDGGYSVEELEAIVVWFKEGSK